ncbi:hypothetical protein LTR36_009129 [Oleoguttula mirabilis]|uniref:tRNA wybutosine-synthesizing protein 2 n=1 Tax=Oleoguttula mirabilis TaxID=1507867 RepID=A0AAV9J693_9PEZI|nr:hypothetical protein LTR36_009129 [Oleoguttula mirabilis]
MERATTAWTSDLGESSGSKWVPAFAHKLNRSYVVYGALVLLPSAAYDELDRLGFGTGAIHANLQRLYELIAHHLKVTHIAVTRPIPPRDDEHARENVIRAPRNFTPLYGEFGPATCSSPPTQEEFDAAFWVTAKQNGIYQTWAPRWTMFSRGNISEKARLLSLPSVLSAVEDGGADGRGCTAVDMYAGIGYFTFSYLKAGVSKMLCWDLNPWSIEGLMRGAVVNKWQAKLVTGSQTLDAAVVGQARLLVFNEDNMLALGRVEQARNLVPPIRHVNCGLLPTSSDSWEPAVGVIDPGMGGWIHVHENFAVNEIEQKAEEVRVEIQRLVEQRGQRIGCEDHRHPQSVAIEHINRLKSYAPGVMHCVIDIYIPPRTPS